MMRLGSGFFVLVLTGLISACGPSEGLVVLEGDDTLPSDAEMSSTGQQLIDCAPRQDTGYSGGQSFGITVVTIDGKPVERDTANAFWVMQEAAARQGVSVRVVSGFRTMAEQQYLYACYRNCNCNGCNLAASPGYSNHQSGHALDLNTSAGGVSAWLNANAARFGFRRTVPSEPWHWEWWGGGPGGAACSSAPVIPNPSGPPPAAPGCGGLAPGQAIGVGQSLTSCNGALSLWHQGDGNVVLYDNRVGVALWSTGTHGIATSTLVMQGDGNLVLYGDGGARWSSGTHSRPGAIAALQDDGNLVIYGNSYVPLWSTGTQASPQPPPCGALGPNQSLAPGQEKRSCDGRSVVVHQTDGNVVLYGPGGALWSTGTHGQATSSFVMQGDGNLVLYGAGGAKWASGSQGAAAFFAVQDDGNLVIYGPGAKPIWVR